jgi:hypothetical protein
MRIIFALFIAGVRHLICHAKRSSEESKAILTAESKHPYPSRTAGRRDSSLRSE